MIDALSILYPNNTQDEVLPTPQGVANLEAEQAQLQAEQAAFANTEINIYNSEGFQESGLRGDGDNPIRNSRLAFNKDVASERGKSIDTYETPKDEEWLSKRSNQKKMYKQRQALARAAGVDMSKITNENVFTMGLNAQAMSSAMMRTMLGWVLLAVLVSFGVVEQAGRESS